jgi:hypothetical protein
LFLLAILWSLLLVANPGVFSHDELQKVDHVLRHGFADYVNLYARMYQGTEFGQPVRPISFLVQGVVSLFMPNYPVFGHALDVVSHGLITVVLFRAVLLYSGHRQFAWISAVVFACSPLATFSVGWMAALMDRFYILFGLVAFIAASQFATRRAGAHALVVLVLASSLAILSKETAVVLPATLLLLFILPPPQAIVDRRRLLIAAVLWLLPVVAFLIYRAPALVGSVSAPSASAYAISPGNVVDGVVVYGIYPFLPSLAEAHTWIFEPLGIVVAAGAAHLVLVSLLWLSFSARVASLYVVAYFGFLAPVLLIPTKGAHYLYGAGLAFGVALSAVMVLSRYRSRVWLVFPVVVLVVISALHSLKSQLFIYRTGTCMNTAALSLESSYLGAGRPGRMRIVVDSGAPGHILHRLTAGREQVGNYYPVRIDVLEGARNFGDVAAEFQFNSDCVVHAR